MADYSLHSLLPRGTKTWHRREQASTIDLVFVSDELSAALIKCRIHQTEHGSDHRAIESMFDIELPLRLTKQRLLFKSAPWAAIQARVAAGLYNTPIGVGTQEQADQLMAVVIEAVYALTPKAKPSPYAKRWWTTDLSNLRCTYTHWRNQARASRRLGAVSCNLEQRARDAAKEYHDAIRRQKKAHWDEFLGENTNIWQAARFLSPSNSPSIRQATTASSFRPVSCTRKRRASS